MSSKLFQIGKEKRKESDTYCNTLKLHLTVVFQKNTAQILIFILFLHILLVFGLEGDSKFNHWGPKWIKFLQAGRAVSIGGHKLAAADMAIIKIPSLDPASVN